MIRVIFTHLYVILMAIVVVTAGNIIADQYGRQITSSISEAFRNVDTGMNDVESTVSDWNKKILE